MARHMWNIEPQGVYSDPRKFRKDFDKIHWHARSSSLNHKCLFGIFCTFDLWRLCSSASFFRFFHDYEKDEDGNYVVNSAGNVWDDHDHGEVSRWSYWSSLSWDDHPKTPQSHDHHDHSEVSCWSYLKEGVRSKVVRWGDPPDFFISPLHIHSVQIH